MSPPVVIRNDGPDEDCALFGRCDHRDSPTRTYAIAIAVIVGLAILATAIALYRRHCVRRRLVSELADATSIVQENQVQTQPSQLRQHILPAGRTTREPEEPAPPYEPPKAVATDSFAHDPPAGEPSVPPPSYTLTN